MHHVCSDEGSQTVEKDVSFCKRRNGGQEFLLEHWVSVKREIIFNHAICNLLWHFILWHFVLWQILSGKFGAIDTGGEDVGLIAARNVELLHSLHERSIDSFVSGDGG